MTYFSPLLLSLVKVRWASLWLSGRHTKLPATDVCSRNEQGTYDGYKWITLTFCAIRSLWDGYMLPFTFSVAWFPRCDTGRWCSHNFAAQCLLMSTSDIILLWWPQEGNNLKLQAVITDEPDISNIHDTVQGSSYLIKHRFEFKLGHGWLICMWRAAIPQYSW